MLLLLQISARDLHAAVAENNGKSHSPNVINIELDTDRGRNQVVTKSITLGELTDTIITKDYSPTPFLPLRQPPFPPYRNPESISTTENWNYNRRMQQKEAQQHQSPSPQQQHHSTAKNPAPGRSTPDDRHIIRMAQSPSPRNKSFHESATPPVSYHYPPGAGLPPNAGRPPPPTSASGHQFALDCYVKNRIAEAMRTEDDKRAEELHERDRRTPLQQQPPGSSAHHNKDVDRSGTPADMVVDEDASSNAASSTSSPRPPLHHPLINSQYGTPPVTTFAAATTYAYPYSALNVSAAPSSLPPPLKPSNDNESNNRPQAPPAQEPKPLLSAQYEALSDED